MGVILNPLTGQFDFKGSGISQAAADARYVNITGDTMTGDLVIDTRLAIGTTIDTAKALNVLKSYTDTSGVKYAALINAKNTAASGSANITGLQTLAEFNGSYNQTADVDNMQTVGLFGYARNISANTANILKGGAFWVDNTAAGAILTAKGFEAYIHTGGAGVITFAQGISTVAWAESANITTYYGINILDGVSFGAQIGTQHGVHIANMTGGTTNRGIVFDGTGTSNGLEWATDTNLYRNGANILKTDDAFVVGGAITVTSGSITGITDLAVADGGTGASTAADARTNLGLVAGGAGDIWVEKAGDTMTGKLTINPTTDTTALSIGGTSPAQNEGGTYGIRFNQTLSGVVDIAQEEFVSNVILPTINLTGGASNTVTGVYGQVVNMVINNGTATNVYGYYVAAPTGAGTITNKFSIVTETGAGGALFGDYLRVGSISAPANTTAGDLTFIRGFATSLALTGAITGATGYNGLVITANTGTITTGVWNGTDIAVADGGTGASTAADARTNLGLVAGGAGDIWVEKAGDTMTGQLLIDGGSDQIQLLVQGNGTQTSLLAVWEDSAGGDQITFSGTGAAVFNEAGNDADHRMEGDTDANLFFLDASTDRIGIGNAAPGSKLHVTGKVTIASGGVSNGAIDITSSGGPSVVQDTTDGNGISIRGRLDSSRSAKLRIVANNNGWNDGQDTAYFQADTTNGSRKLTFLSGDYGGDSTFLRLQFNSEGTQFTDLFYTSTMAPTAVLEAISGTVDQEVFKILSVATNDDPNYRIYQGRAATTDATVTTVQTITITASNSYLIESRIVARRTGGVSGTADDGAVYIRRALVTTKAGTVTISAVQDGLTQEDQAGWDATFTVSGASILVRVTGAASNNITWHATTIVQHLST